MKKKHAKLTLTVCVDPDQMSHKMVSDQSLHLRFMTASESGHNYVIVIRQESIILT